MRTSSPIRGPGGLPVIKPPWSRITAIDLKEGDFLWQVPHGDGPRDHPLLADLDLPRLGEYPVAGLPPGWIMATKTLLFSAVAVPRDPEQPRAAASGFVRAYDKSSGELVWEQKLEQDPRGAPMTYVHSGRQYIVVPTGGAGETPRRLLPGHCPARPNRTLRSSDSLCRLDIVLFGPSLPRLGEYPVAGLPPGWIMATKTLLFTAVAVPRDPMQPRAAASGFVRAYDKSNGALVWEQKLEQDPRGAPMTYVHEGRQYIVVPTGGAGETPRRLLAWSLPV